MANEIKITVIATGAEQAAKVLADVAKSGAQIGGVTAAGAKKAEDALLSLGGAAKRVFQIFTGVSLANIFTEGLQAARQYALELERIGEATLKAERAFQAMTQAVNVNGGQLLARMKEVSRGLADADDIMLASARALQQGLNPEQLVKLMDIAADRAKFMGVTVAEAFNGMADAIATGQTRAFKNANLIVDAEKAYKAYADRLNTVPEALNAQMKSYALLEAVVQESERQTKGVTTALDENVDALERHRIAVNNWKQDQGKALATAKAQSTLYFDDLMMRSAQWLERMGRMRDEWARMGPLGFLAGPRTGTSFTDEQEWKIPQAALTGGAAIGGLDPAAAGLAANEARIKAVDAALKLLNASLAAGTITGREYIAGLEKQIAGLQKLGGSLDANGRIKLLELQATLQKFNPGPKLEAMFDDFEDWNGTLKAIGQNNAGWVAVAEAIERGDWDELAALLKITNDKLAEQKKALDDVNAGWVAHAQAIEDGRIATLNTIAKGNEPLRAYYDNLERINLQAKLLGPSFDVLTPTIAEVTKEIVRLAESGKDVTALQEKLAGLKQVQELKGIFTDVFQSIGSAISTSIQGVILGTQTLAKAWDNLWKSIVLSFANSGIQRVLKGLQDWALDFFVGKSSGGGSGGGGLLGALLGGGGSGRALAMGAGGAPLAGEELSPGAYAQAAVDSVGGFTKAMQVATSGASNFATSISSIGTGLWGAAGFSGGALGPAFTGVGAVDVAVAGGSLTDIGAAASAAAGPISAMSVGLAGVGAAVAAFGTIMDFVNGKTEAAVGGLVGGVTGAVAGGLIGAYFGPGGIALGALAGGALGDWLGSMLGGLFGGPSNYQLQRAKAADEANAYLGGATQGYQSALNTRSPAQILAALQSTGTGVNPLRTELVLSSQVAAQLGITGEREGDTIIARWTDVNEAQMNELIALFKRQPDLVAGSVRGAGDVGYLPQDKAHEFSAQLELGAEALLTAFTGLGAVTDKINAVARDLTAAAKEALPPGLAQEFADGIVNPIRDRMLAVLNSGLPVAEMQKQLDAINTELQGKVEAWNMFAVAIKQATVVDALIPADLHAQFRAVMEPAYAGMLNAMRNGTAAQAKEQADHFATQTQAWAAFADAVQAQVGVEMLLAPIADLGDRFSAAMQPVYDKILASLVAGNGAIALAQAQTFAKLTQAWAALGSTVSKSIDVESLLPDDLGDKFRARMQPEYDKILATLASGNAEVAAALIATFDKQLAAWASIGQTVTRITGELAGLTGNLDGSVEAWVAVQEQMDGAVTRAQAAFDTALAGGNVERIAATAAALHEAAVTRVQAETQMLERVKKLDVATLAASSSLVDLVETITTLSIETSGSLGPLETLLGSLEQMARTGTTTAQRLWAIEAGLQAIAEVLPGLIERFAAFTRAADFLAAGPQTAEQLGGIPSGITGAVVSGAGPFLTALEGLIDTATGEGKLALLQTQAAQFQSLATAAIAGINQWAQAAIAGAREAAAAVIEGARTEAARRIDVARTEAARRQALIEAARETTLAGLDAQIEATQDLAQLEQEARRAEMDAMQEMIAKSKEWASAVESMGKFIQSLKVGPLGPGNPADKLRQSQDVFAQALAAYNANPTAGGLSDLQGLAQTMLSLAEPIVSKASPQFQALSATTIKQLQAAQALAHAQVTDSAVLQAQLDTLIAIDKAATQAAQDLLEGLRTSREAVSQDFDRQTTELSEALEQYVGGIGTALKDYETAVETELQKQVAAIERAAKDEVTAINTNLIGALNTNATAQARLIGEQRDTVDALVHALSSTEFKGVKLGDIATYAAQRQDVAIGILEQIRAGISLAVGQPLAMGSERVTEGLYHLHDGEMVVPKPMADRIRSAADGAGLPTDPGTLMGIVDNWATYSPDEQQGIIAAYNALDPGQQQAVTNTISYWSVASDPKNTAAIKKNYADVPVGFRFEDFWAEKAHFTKTGQGIYAPGYGPGATPGSVVQNVTPGAPPPPVIPPMPPPPTTPPPVPPYVPPSPPWLSRGAGATAASGASGAAYSAEDYGGGGSGPVTIIVKLDGKTIGEATLPTVQADARRGKLQTIILETRPR